MWTIGASSSTGLASVVPNTDTTADWPELVTEPAEARRTPVLSRRPRRPADGHQGQFLEQYVQWTASPVVPGGSAVQDGPFDSSAQRAHVARGIHRLPPLPPDPHRCCISDDIVPCAASSPSTPGVHPWRRTSQGATLVSSSPTTILPRRYRATEGTVAEASGSSASATASTTALRRWRCAPSHPSRWNPSTVCRSLSLSTSLLPRRTQRWERWSPSSRQSCRAAARTRTSTASSSSCGARCTCRSIRWRCNAQEAIHHPGPTDEAAAVGQGRR